MPVKPYVHLRHFAFTDPGSAWTRSAEIAAAGRLPRAQGGLPRRHRVQRTRGALPDRRGVQRQGRPGLSDYTGQQVYYKSLQTSREDFLTIKDYIWRWDTDWFWCSRRSACRDSKLRPFSGPRQVRRSNVYRKLVALDQKHG